MLISFAIGFIVGLVGLALGMSNVGVIFTAIFCALAFELANHYKNGDLEEIVEDYR